MVGILVSFWDGLFLGGYVSFRECMGKVWEASHYWESHYSGEITTTKPPPVGHLKWWFSEGIFAKKHLLKSGVGIKDKLPSSHLDPI